MTYWTIRTTEIRKLFWRQLYLTAMNPQKEVNKLLHDAEAVLVRQNGHKVFEFPDGAIWVTPSTPSDHRSWMNNLSDLRRKLGIRRVVTVTRLAQVQRPRASTNPKSDKKVWREYLATADILPLAVCP